MKLVTQFNIISPPLRITFPRFRAMELSEREEAEWLAKLCGPWVGRFMYDLEVKGKQYNEEDSIMELQFRWPNQILGQGVDLAGIFQIEGEIDLVSSRVAILKNYSFPQKAQWMYDGTIDKFGIGGQWRNSYWFVLIVVCLRVEYIC
jgi:hypothetical protein